MSKRSFRILRKEVSKKRYDYFIFFDTETYEKITKEDKQKELFLKIGYALFWDRKNNLTDELTFYDNDVFWAWIFEKSRDKNVVIFAHNIDFDLKIVNGLDYLLKNNFNLKKFWIEHSFLIEFEKDKTVINLWDTMNYFNMSLEKLGEAIGIKKLEVEFKTVNNEDLLKYCKNDVKIIFEAIKRLIEFLEIYNLGELKATSASLSMNIYRKKFMRDKKIYIHNAKKVQELEDSSYRGGFCDCFKIGKFTEKLYFLDVNSMYPFVMKNHKSPTKLIEYEYKNGCHNLFKLFFKALKEDKSVIAKVNISIDKEHSYIITKAKIDDEVKCMRLSGTYTSVLNTAELRYVLKYGQINDIYEIAVYDNDFLFTKFVNFFYNKRKKYEKKHNYAFALFCKFILVSLYGKFAQKKYKFEKNEIECDDYEIKSYMLYTSKNVQLITQLGKNRYRFIKTDLPDKFTFTAISSEITAYGRCFLSELIELANIDNVYYCDTDSLMVNEKGYQNLKHLIDEDKLGYLKLVDESILTEITNPKAYKFNGEVTLKGVKEEAKKIIETETATLYKQDSWKRYKSSLRNKKTDRQEIDILFKIIKKEYNKGNIVNGVVIPYEVNDKNNDMIKIE